MPFLCFFQYKELNIQFTISPKTNHALVVNIQKTFSFTSSINEYYLNQIKQINTISESLGYFPTDINSTNITNSRIKELLPELNSHPFTISNIQIDSSYNPTLSGVGDVVITFDLELGASGIRTITLNVHSEKTYAYEK